MKFIAKRERESLTFQTKQREWSLDYLKIIFAFVICLHHFWFYGHTNPNIIVEGFFAISGIYVCKAANEKPKNVGIYVLKKWLGLLPYLAIAALSAFTCNLLMMLISHSFSWVTFGKNIFLAIMDIIPFSLNKWTLNGAIWYIGALLLSSMFIYPIAKIINEKHGFIYLIICLFCFIFSYYVWRQFRFYGYFAHWYRYLTFVTNGVLGMSFGCFLYIYGNAIKEMKLHNAILIIGTILVLLLTPGIIVIPIYFKKMYIEILCIVMCFGIIGILYFHLSWFNSHYYVKYWKLASMYSLMLYLTHIPMEQLMYKIQGSVGSVGVTIIVLVYPLILSIILLLIKRWIKINKSKKTITSIEIKNS